MLNIDTGSLLGGLDGKILVILKEVFFRLARPSSLPNVFWAVRLKIDLSKDIS